jgi:hypothetical protein
MVYNTRYYWASFRKQELFPPSGEGETPSLLDPLERADLNNSTTYVGITTTV